MAPTLVFNGVKRLAGDPDTLIDVGIGFIAGGLTAGLSGFLAVTTVYPLTPQEMLSEVLFDAGYIGVCGGLGISLIVRGRRARL